MTHPSPTHKDRMNLPRHNALVAILARIDEQIAESDALLLTTLTGGERRRVMDELVYLQIERLKAAANFHNNR
jgi:hypothetical protein